MGNCKNPRKNSEGYNDPTTYEALKNIERNEKRIRKLRETILHVCDLAGVSILGKLTFIDKNTGQPYR